MDSSARWWTKDTVAVVTGANKGIGFEIAKQLAENGVTVVLTARDQQRGLHALARLKHLITPSFSSNVVFHPLDVCSSHSISAFASWLTTHYNGADILVNNAAVASANYDSSYDISRQVLDTNYAGVKRVTKALLPCMKASAAGARIVNVSSSLGQLQDAQEGDVTAKGWPAMYPAYSVSKVAVNAYTRVLAKSLQNQPPGHKIYVNCMNPGYCKTDLNDNKGLLPPAQGADTAVWLALLPPPLPTGEFFDQREPLSY